MARKELAQLHRQYRVMETDRQTYIQGRNLSHQEKMLDYLRNEKSDLLVDIQNAMSKANQRKDKRSELIIGSMLEAYFRCMEEIQAQIEEILELETQVDKITKRVIAQKLKTQAAFGQSLTVGQVARKLRILENRKHHFTTLFDSKATDNSLLREDINLSLMERGRFHERYRQLKRRIAAAKHKMLIVVDNALTTYEAREEAIMKIHMLRERNDKESQQHVLEIKEYQRVFHHDQKLRSFMKIKNKTREVVEKSEERSQRITFDKEKHLDDLIRQYRKSFSQLLAQTKDVETLLNQYLSQEQENFSRFKYITDLNNETCVLEEGIRKLKDDIEKAVRRTKNNRVYQATNLKELSRLRERSSAQLTELTQNWKIIQENMTRIVHGVDVIFDRAGCENAPVIQLLGNRSGILPRNLVLCLKVLENRIRDLQYMHKLLEVKKAIVVDRVDKSTFPVKQGYWQPGKKPPPAGGLFKPQVILTGMSNDVDEEDEESEKQMSTHRMTYEEIKEFYRDKFIEHNPMDFEPQEMDVHSQVESLSNVKTKSKFGPPISAIQTKKKSIPLANSEVPSNRGSVSSKGGDNVSVSSRNPSISSKAPSLDTRTDQQVEEDEDEEEEDVEELESNFIVDE